MTLEAILKYPVVFLAALATTLVVTPLWRRLATRRGGWDRPGWRSARRQAVPRGGGLAVFLGFHVACAVVFLVPWKPFAGQLSSDWWFRFLPLSLAVVSLGLLDDRFDLRPLTKFIGQIAIGLAAYAVGIRLQNLLGMDLPQWVDVLATVGWFVALMNAFNLIDGVDGLATGIALIAATGIGLSLVFRGQPGDVLLFIGFAGACLGFLRYNSHPANVFLGDSGSYWLGFTLAALAISTHSKASFMAGLGMPMLAVGVPLFDAMLAVWRRSMRRILRQGATGEPGPGIEIGDEDHLHHRLLRQGRGHSQVAWLLYAATAALVAIGLLASTFNDRALGILALAFLLAAYTIVRHLADIELRESGRVVLQGLSRPVRRNQTLLLYLAGDLGIMSLGLWLSLVLLAPRSGLSDPSLKAIWLRSVPLDLVAPFVALLLVRSYSRVWYLARISEYAATGLAVVFGYAVAFGLRLLGVYNPFPPAELPLYYMLLAGMVTTAIVFSRAASRVVQDVMPWLLRGAVSRDGTPPERALVCGVGFRATLFLRQVAHRSRENVPMDIVGIVSDDRAITGHYVHGVRVLGTCRELSALVVRHRIDVLYLVEPVTEADLDEIRGKLSAFGIRVVRWDIVETEIPLAPRA